MLSLAAPIGLSHELADDLLNNNEVGPVQRSLLAMRGLSLSTIKKGSAEYLKLTLDLHDEKAFYEALCARVLVIGKPWKKLTVEKQRELMISIVKVMKTSTKAFKGNVDSLLATAARVEFTRKVHSLVVSDDFSLEKGADKKFKKEIDQAQARFEAQLTPSRNNILRVACNFFRFIQGAPAVVKTERKTILDSLKMIRPGKSRADVDVVIKDAIEREDAIFERRGEYLLHASAACVEELEDVDAQLPGIEKDLRENEDQITALDAQIKDKKRALIKAEEACEAILCKLKDLHGLATCDPKTHRLKDLSGLEEKLERLIGDERLHVNGLEKLEVNGLKKLEEELGNENINTQKIGEWRNSLKAQRNRLDYITLTSLREEIVCLKKELQKFMSHDDIPQLKSREILDAYQVVGGEFEAIEESVDRHLKNYDDYKKAVSDFSEAIGYRKQEASVMALETELLRLKNICGELKKKCAALETRRTEMKSAVEDYTKRLEKFKEWQQARAEYENEMKDSKVSLRRKAWLFLSGPWAPPAEMPDGKLQVALRVRAIERSATARACLAVIDAG